MVNYKTSADKIHDHEMQNNMGKNKVSQSSFLGNMSKLPFVFRIDLHTQASCKTDSERKNTTKPLREKSQNTDTRCFS